jgi:hypothetical protein
MILAGLVVGPVLLERRSRPHGLLIVALLGLAWGLTVSFIAEEPFVETFVGATLLGLVNLAVGAALAIGLTLLLRTVRRLVLRV